MILIIIIRLRATPGDNQAAISDLEKHQDNANNLMTTSIDIYQDVGIALQGVKSQRAEAFQEISGIRNEAFNYKRGLQKSSALLYAAKRELTEKANELIR
jgi:hypothetical protein